MKNALLSTAMHVIELLVVVAVAWFLISVLHIDSETWKIVLGLVLASLAKFARANEASPVPDYTR
ncbi:MAG: hypothetical protein ABIH47_00215 [Candidatus Omnitrophota bacterium]